MDSDNSYDYTADYKAEVNNDVVADVVEPTVAIEESVVTVQSYEIRDGDEIQAARNMNNAVNYDLIILIVLVVALIGGAVFFYLKQRQQSHQQVPQSDPEEQKVEETDAPVENETIVADTKE